MNVLVLQNSGFIDFRVICILPVATIQHTIRVPENRYTTLVTNAQAYR
jgi:hypothetical protein